LKQVAEQHQDMTELVEKESVLVKEIAERSKMNYRAWRHRCWLIPYMTRKQVLDELKKSTRWSELHVADNCCFHYRRVSRFLICVFSTTQYLKSNFVYYLMVFIWTCSISREPAQ